MGEVTLIAYINFLPDEKPEEERTSRPAVSL